MNYTGEFSVFILINNEVMEIMRRNIMVLVPEEEWSEIIKTQHKILEMLQGLGNKGAESSKVKNITAIEFMEAVRIGRTKFDHLVSSSKIKTIKKRRKIYVPVSEVDRYFADPSIP